MPTRKYSFYIDGVLKYICYSQLKALTYEATLIKMGLEYELKVESLFY